MLVDVEIIFNVVKETDFDPAVPNATVNINYSEINNLTINNNFYTNYTPIIQMSMEIEFGVCENQINTQKNYRT